MRRNEISYKDIVLVDKRDTKRGEALHKVSTNCLILYKCQTRSATYRALTDTAASTLAFISNLLLAYI